MKKPTVVQKPIYESSNLPVVLFLLCCKLKLIGSKKEKDNRGKDRTVFLIEDREDRDKLLQEYRDDTAFVNPKLYESYRRECMSIINER